MKHKTESKYRLWQEGFHPQIIYSEKVFRQKVDYINFNTVKKGPEIQPEYWRYSSAASYILGAKGKPEINSLE